MKSRWAALAAGLVALATPAGAKNCPADSVPVGNVCVDLYEASAWETIDAKTIKKIRAGKIKSAEDLAQATQRGETDDYDPACPDNAGGCTSLYAVSLAGVAPARNLTWFQAEAACRNAGKRLLRNQEWQAAALGTPDPGTDDGATSCNIQSAGPVPTGSRSACVSDVGAFDLVGNVWEWVAEWGGVATSCTNYGAAYGTDVSCVGSGSGGSPGALLRGGDFGSGASAGVYAISAHFLTPDVSSSYFGFRCGRDL